MRACQYLVRGLPTFRFRGSFDWWLAKLAERAVIDERRTIVGRGKQQPPITESLDVLEETAGGVPTDHPMFRSRYTAHPEALVRDSEHRELVTAMLVLHAQTSNRDADSALAIRRRWWNENSVDEIARLRGSTDRDVFRLFAHDLTVLRGLLIEHFRISALRDL